MEWVGGEGWRHLRVIFYHNRAVTPSLECHTCKRRNNLDRLSLLMTTVESKSIALWMWDVDAIVWHFPRVRREGI